MGWLADYYSWIKAAHIMAVIAWMAGLFYLPRLYVYHAEQVARETETDALFQVMEEKLLRIIMNPAMIAAWVLGIMLALTPGIVHWGLIWPWTKLAALLAMTWFHMWLAMQRKAFAQGNNRLSGKRYRLMNEVPTVLMVVIVASAVVKF